MPRPLFPLAPPPIDLYSPLQGAPHMSFGQQVSANDDTGFKQFAPRAGLIPLPNEDGSHVYTIPPLSYELGLELRACRENVNAAHAVIQRSLTAAIDVRKTRE